MWINLLFLILALAKSFVNGSAGFQTSPACHPGILRLFRWCEQSECSDCTCLSAKHVCKQICNKRQCKLLFCSSPQTCYQSVLVEYGRRKPVVDKLVSHTPITQQDCSQATCKYMKAVRYKDKPSQSFQSCSEGKCGHIYSNADIAKQFCGDCDKMTCTGKHAKNCTQLCVLGECKDMTCNAKHCKQLCSHQSKCTLSCGPNAETCDQTCSHWSTCTMKWKGITRVHQCNDSHNCTEISKTAPETTQSPTTTTTTTKSTTLKVITTKIKLQTSTPTELDDNNTVYSLKLNAPNQDFPNGSIVIFVG